MGMDHSWGLVTCPLFICFLAWVEPCVTPHIAVKKRSMPIRFTCLRAKKHAAESVDHSLCVHLAVNISDCHILAYWKILAFWWRSVQSILEGRLLNQNERFFGKSCRSSKMCETLLRENSNMFETSARDRV